MIERIRRRRADDVRHHRGKNIAKVSGINQHPLVGLTIKTGVASAVAWKLGNLMPPDLAQYSYYAPLGALTVMYSVLSDSVKEAFKAGIAFTIGVLGALTLYKTALPNAFSVGIALGVGILVGKVARLGAQSTWVPLAALFVFTAGRNDLNDYTLGYLLQITLGMVVGLVVNATVFPSLGLHDVERHAMVVRTDIGDSLQAFADHFRHPTPQTEDQLRMSCLQGLPASAAVLRELGEEAGRAGRGNFRRARWDRVRADVLGLNEATQACALLLEDLAREVLEDGLKTVTDDQRRALGDAAATVKAAIDNAQFAVVPGERAREANELLDASMRDEAPYIAERITQSLRRCVRLAAAWVDET